MPKMKTVFRGRLFTVKQWPVKMPDGSTCIFERAVRVPTVIVFPIDSAGKIILTQELRQGRRTKMWFAVTGRIEKGEAIKHSALRELREEAGISARRLTLVYSRRFAANTLEWKTYVFVATGLFPAPLSGDPDENISTHPVSMTKAYRMALDGTISDPYMMHSLITIFRQRRRFLALARQGRQAYTRRRKRL